MRVGGFGTLEGNAQAGLNAGAVDGAISNDYAKKLVARRRPIRDFDTSRQL